MKNHSKAKFIDWDETPSMVVELVGPFKREKDAEKPKAKDGVLAANEKAGAVIGYECMDLNDDGNPVIAGNSYAIEKAMADAKKGTVFGIEFLGQKKTKAGQNVNEFNIKEAENDEDVQKLLKKLNASED